MKSLYDSENTYNDSALNYAANANLLLSAFILIFSCKVATLMATIVYKYPSKPLQPLMNCVLIISLTLK